MILVLMARVDAIIDTWFAADADDAVEFEVGRSFAAITLPLR